MLRHKEGFKMTNVCIKVGIVRTVLTMLVGGACPPDPCPAHTAVKVYRGGTQSDSNPETQPRTSVSAIANH